MSILKTQIKFLLIALVGAYFGNMYGIHAALDSFYNKDVWIYNPITNIKAMLEFCNFAKFGEEGYNTALFTFFGAFIPYVACMTIWHMIFGKKKSDVHGSAYWATLKQIKNKFQLLNSPSKVIGGRPGVIIGAVESSSGKSFTRDDPEDSTRKTHVKLQHLVYSGSSHLCLIAPTGGGKGVGIIVPNLLNYPDSVVVNDMKGTEYLRTGGYRSTHLNNLVLKFEPANGDGTSIQFNPMDFIRAGTQEEYLQAQKISLQLIDIEGKGISGDHFKSNGADLLGAVMLHILYTRKNQSPADVLAFISGVDPDTDEPYASVKEFLAEMCGADFKPKANQKPSSRQKQSHLQAYAQLHGMSEEQARQKLGNLIDSFGYVRTIKKVALALFNNDGEKEVAGIVSSAKTALGLFNSPTIAHNTKTSTLNLADLQNGERPVSLYIVVKKEYQALLNPLIRVLLSQIFEEVHRNKIKEIKRELLFILDEFPQLGRMDDVTVTMATIREFRARFLIVTQNLDFLEEYYDKTGAQTILGNCDIKICYPNGSQPTCEIISKWVGDATVIEKNVSKSVQRNGLLGGGSVTTNTSQNAHKRPLIMPEEISKMGDMTIVYVVGKGPIKGTAYRYFEDKEMLSLIDKPIPPQEYFAPRAIESKPTTTTAHSPDNEKNEIKKKLQADESQETAVFNAKKYKSMAEYMLSENPPPPNLKNTSDKSQNDLK